MSIVDSTGQLVAGMQVVERGIIAEVRGRGALIDVSSFRWNHGQGSFAELPSVIHMAVKVGTNRAEVNWSAIKLQDSWQRIDRPDVRQEIDRIVEMLAPARIQPSNKPFEIK